LSCELLIKYIDEDCDAEDELKREDGEELSDEIHKGELKLHPRFILVGIFSELCWVVVLVLVIFLFVGQRRFLVSFLLLLRLLLLRNGF